MLEQGRGTGSLKAAKATRACLSRVGRESGRAGRVVDVEVVLVPVPSMCLQPSFLLPIISGGQQVYRIVRTGIGPMKKRRDVR